MNNIKKVSVVRLTNEYEKKQIQLKNDLFSRSITNLQAPLKKGGGGTIDHGLSDDQIRVIMPRIINVSSESHEFYQKVDHWFRNYYIKLGTDIIELDITTRKEKHKIFGEMVELEIPVKPLDYIQYMILKNINTVADIGVTANPLIHRYKVVSLEDELKKEEAKVSVKQEAMLEFNNLPEASHRMYLALIEQKEGKFLNVNQLNSVQVKNALFEKADNDPKTFLEVHKDKDIQDKYFVNLLVSLGVVEKAGNTLFYNSVDLGDINRAVAYLNNPINSHTLSELKAKLREAHSIDFDEYRETLKKAKEIEEKARTSTKRRGK